MSREPSAAPGKTVCRECRPLHKREAPRSPRKYCIAQGNRHVLLVEKLLKRDMIAVFRHLKGCWKGEGKRLFSCCGEQDADQRREAAAESV